MSDQFERVVAIMAQLRAPGGCPWDRKQTHESLKPYLMEETYEALDAIDRGRSRQAQRRTGRRASASVVSQSDWDGTGDLYNP